MVLEELGEKITAALQAVQRAAVVDDTVFEECLKEICNTLIRADVEAKLVVQLKMNIKKRVKLQDLAAGLNRQSVIQAAVFDELCVLLDGSQQTPSFQPKKGKPNVIMFVGLQGNGKTTTCMKYAHFYKKKGFKCGMICADTFRAGAFDQLKQNATKAGVPFYGSYTETDPAVIARDGVERFKADRKDLIIVDTSGRHSQSEALFEEMRQVASLAKPDLIVFVMDATTGQSAGDQARAFKDSVEVGAVIITKMDGSAKGGSTLSAVAATKSPVVFLGTGEHMDAFEPFDAKSFVSRLLGRGDLKGLTKKLEEVMPQEKQDAFMETVSKGQFNFRFFRDFIENVGSMGPLSSVMSMMPMFSNMKLPQGGDRETQIKFKRYITIMDSMTDKELDETDIKKLKVESRIMRWARGAGVFIEEVLEMLTHFELMSKSASKLTKATKGLNPRNMQASLSQLTNAVPPHVLKQMGGMQGMGELMKQLNKMPGGGLPGLR